MKHDDWALPVQHSQDNARSLQDGRKSLVRRVVVLGAALLAATSLLQSPAPELLNAAHDLRARWSTCPCLIGSLQDWIEQERDVAWRGILANIGPPAGAAPGLVIASPSTSQPDYCYTWTRDSALTLSTIFDRFAPSANDTAYPHPDLSLGPLLREYVLSQEELQLVKTPSGGLLNGGLGEPKYHVNGSAFTGSWGRPQRDGPPLRALVVARYAAYLLQRGTPADRSFIQGHLYNPAKLITPASILKSDLEYTAHNWHKTSFDLWEEIDGHHFFTLLASQRALEHGADIAKQLDDPFAAEFYLAQATTISKRLEDFWQAEMSLITAALDPRSFGRSGLDAAVVLAIIHVGGADGQSWSVTDERVLATLVKYIDSFRHGLYKINGRDLGRCSHGAIAVGRYREDVYNGTGVSRANPWFISTFAVSQLLYRLATASLLSGRITITPISLSFWQTFNATIDAHQVLERSDDQFDQMLHALARYADGFLHIGRTYAGPGGTLTEQFSRLDGSPTGARNLTWSYSAFIDATNERNQFHHLFQHA